MTTTAKKTPRRPELRNHWQSVRLTAEEKLQAHTLARKAGHKGDVSALLRDLLARAAQADTRPAAGR